MADDIFTLKEKAQEKGEPLFLELAHKPKSVCTNTFAKVKHASCHVCQIYVDTGGVGGESCQHLRGLSLSTMGKEVRATPLTGLAKQSYTCV